jgi:hypothetical protein
VREICETQVLKSYEKSIGDPRMYLFFVVQMSSEAVRRGTKGTNDTTANGWGKGEAAPLPLAEAVLRRLITQNHKGL